MDDSVVRCRHRIGLTPRRSRSRRGAGPMVDTSEPAHGHIILRGIDGEGLLRPIGREDNSPMDGLPQPRARSHREIEANAADLARTETGRSLLEEATELLAAMPL